MKADVGAIAIIFFGTMTWLIVGDDGTDILRAEDILFVLKLVCVAGLWIIIARCWDRWWPMDEKDRDEENRIW